MSAWIKCDKCNEMTNKEAISDLETLLAYIPIYRRFYQSISMGIKALKQGDVLREIRATVNSWAHDIDAGVEAGDAYYDVLELIDSKIKEGK